MINIIKNYIKNSFINILMHPFHEIFLYQVIYHKFIFFNNNN